MRCVFFFSSRRRHTRYWRDWSSDVCSSDLSSKEMDASFVNGAIRFSQAIGNVKTVFYPQEEKDSTLMSLVYMETDTMKMYISPQRKLDRIWTPKNNGTWYPMTQIPPRSEERRV